MGSRFQTDLDSFVGDERSLRSSGLLEVAAVVLGEDLQIGVDRPGVAVRPLGQLADPIRPLGHDAPGECATAVSE